MVWAAFSYSLTAPLVFLETNMDEIAYIDTLQNKFIPFLRSKGVLRSCILMQDGARPHTGNNALKFIKENFPGGAFSDRTENPWPPNSPDLTPVDFWLWGELKTRVYSHPRPTTIDELKDKILRCFNEIPRSHFRNSILSIQKRAHLCLQENGRHFENKL